MAKTQYHETEKQNMYYRKGATNTELMSTAHWWPQIFLHFFVPQVQKQAGLSQDD
jgi:hypothetical protein